MTPGSTDSGMAEQATQKEVGIKLRKPKFDGSSPGEAEFEHGTLCGGIGGGSAAHFCKL